MSRRAAAALLVGLASFCLLVGTAGSASITWDEAIYMRSARQYMEWVDVLRRSPSQAFSAAAITQYWAINSPQTAQYGPVEDIHPPLVKMAAGLSWRLLRGLLGDLVSLRIANMALVGLTLAVLFYWMSEVAGMVAGLAAVLCLLLMPRFFAQAHYLALDAPLACFSLLATYAYWRTADRAGWRWAIPFGILWGLSLASKNGGWLLPLGIVVWMLLNYRTWRHIGRLALSTVIAVGIFLVSWPWLYHDTLARLAWYVQNAFLKHSDLLGNITYYLGEWYETTPWHYPLLITLAVVPATIMFVIMIGALKGVEGSDSYAAAAAAVPATRHVHSLLLLSAVGPMAPFLLQVATAYDGERLFLASFPYLAALGGLGFVACSNSVWNFLWRRWPRVTARRQSRAVRLLLTGGLLLLVFTLPASSVARLEPYQLAYYSELVGGIPGARRLQLETTFWADTYQATLGYLNQNAPTGAKVWADAYQVLWAYQELGRLRKDIVVPGADVEQSAADLAVVQMRESRLPPQDIGPMQSWPAEFKLSLDGVPVVMVFRVH